MNRRIPQSYIDKLLASIDIVDVVRSRTQIVKDHNHYIGNCPFHDDDKKSLVVDQQNQSYSCPVCAVTGSAIGFSMYFDGSHFIDSVQYLSIQCGMSLSGVVSESIIKEPYNNTVELLSEVADYFHSQLYEYPASRSFLKKRGISQHSIERFNIGYAPPRRDYFDTHYPNDKAALARAGVCGRNTDKSYFTRFRDRIMFPVNTPDQQVIGFGGRSISSNEPKYLNSPASSHFNKSDVLYGLSQFILPPVTDYRSQFDALVVEGYIDVVIAHQYGITNTIAPLGTALTEQHVVALKQSFRRVCFCFDGDVAGLAAGKRAFNLVLPHLSDDFRASFCLLPEGDDPDSILNRAGTPVFLSCIEESLDEPSFMIQSRNINKELTGIGPIAALCADLKPQIENIADPALKVECIEALSNFSGISLNDYIQ